jgi:putative membrane protein
MTPRHAGRTGSAAVEVETMTALATLAQMSGGYGGHMDWNDGSSWVMAVVMIVVSVAVVGGIIWAIVFASRSTSHAGPPATPAVPGARDVLDQRYARGEIDTNEYNERRSALG